MLQRTNWPLRKVRGAPIDESSTRAAVQCTLNACSVGFIVFSSSAGRGHKSSYFRRS